MFIIEKWIVIIAKIFSSISIIIPMTLTFSKEQFNVATTFVSFIALFSFAVPKTFQSKSSNTKVNVENTDRKMMKVIKKIILSFIVKPFL
ncbi:hypothetical protein LGVB_00525 [Lactobacillus gasseri]|nr:hypothetical protein [Lactobacillus gasseri]